MPETRVIPAPSVELGCVVSFVLSVLLWMYAEFLYRWPCMRDGDGSERGIQSKTERDDGSVKLLPVKHVYPKDVEGAVVAGDDSSERIQNHSKSKPNNAAFGLADSKVGTNQLKAYRAARDSTSDNTNNHQGTSPSSRISRYISNLSSFVTRCDLFRCLTLDREALLRCRVALRACVELGAIMTWSYFADRHLSAAKDHADGASTVKQHSRDTFFFLFGTLMAAALLASYFSSPPTPTRVSRRHDEASDSILSRDQTEEWKGWMQVFFLMYHYFAATEMYNAIRIFIAAYFWMTGYGNFLYYVKTGDFSLRRVAQTLWRLNFLVAVCCLTMRNSYMLYYISPMHTVFTLMTYATLALAPMLNESLKGQTIKIALCLLVTSVCWESRAVFDTIWSPLTFLVGYQEPRGSTRRSSPTSPIVNSTSTALAASTAFASATAALAASTAAFATSTAASASNAGERLGFAAVNGSIGNHVIEPLHLYITTSEKLHEWHFRSSLDRYVWIYGIACAAAQPFVERWLAKVDLDTSRRKIIVVRCAVALVALAAGGAWFHAFGSLQKLASFAVRKKRNCYK